MNNLARNKVLLRFLRNELQCRVLSRPIHASSCARTTDPKDIGKEDTTSNENKATKPPATRSLFGTLAGMKTVGEPKEDLQQDETTLLQRKSRRKFESDFKTSEALKQAVTKAAKTVSESFSDQEKTESDLLQQLRRYDEAKAAGERGDIDAMSSIFQGMKVQETPKEILQEQKQERVVQDPYQIQRTEERREQPQQSVMRTQPNKHKQSVGLTGGLKQSQRLGIFSLPGEKQTLDTDVTVHGESPLKSIWQEDVENTIRNLVYEQKRHGFDEMLHMTEQGKLWKYPVDNEQGLEEEQAVSFHEHVLLDDLIADFPKTGPIRDFIELVIIGLSKNPYFTVNQKKEHIDWFRQYFKKNDEVLRESGSIEKDFNFV